MSDVTRIRILLVDDHPVVRAGLKAMLSEFAGFTVVAEAADGAEALAAVEKAAALGEPLDIVLMDLQMAGVDGVTATTRIKAAHPDLPVLILTTYDSDSDIVAAVDAGAGGYMLKDAPPERIRQAVTEAAAGQTALAPEIAARLVDRMRNPATALSAREIEILHLLARGQANKQIAQELFISEATVKTHLNHVYDKLGVANRTAAIAVAREQRIIRD